MTSAIEPFRLAVPEADLEDLRTRLERTRWPEREPVADAMPLVMTHGWPGSVLEFMGVIAPLAQDYHLIIPALPGYGFSGKPKETGWGVDRIARVWNALMLALGYPRYFAQGGDWGSAVTSEIASQNLGYCAGIHVNMVVGPVPSPLPDDQIGRASCRERVSSPV
mgnify:CR=1 FL=1